MPLSFHIGSKIIPAAAAAAAVCTVTLIVIAAILCSIYCVYLLKKKLSAKNDYGEYITDLYRLILLAN